MKIQLAEYVISAPGPAQYPQDGLPEIALVGRSNVGKSSLINRLVDRKNLARTSSQPGKTQYLNFYRIETDERTLFLVDLPGYGYAKVSKKRRQQWGEMIESYLRERQMLRHIVLLIDARHPPTEDDRLMYDWLRYYDLPVSVVMTKADKVPKGKWDKHRKIIRRELDMESDREVILFSSETGTGKDELWKHLHRWSK